MAPRPWRVKAAYQSTLARFEYVFFGLFLGLEHYTRRFDSFNCRCLIQIAVKVPANPYVVKFKRSCEATTHGQKNLALCLWRVKAFVNPFLAELDRMLLSGFLAVKDRPIDAFDFYNRAEAIWTQNNPP